MQKQEIEEIEESKVTCRRGGRDRKKSEERTEEEEGRTELIKTMRPRDTRKILFDIRFMCVSCLESY